MSSNKVKRFETFPRARRRNSVGSKPLSHGTHNGRVTLLKNNRSLAATLEDTRCELLIYKNFFEESVEFVNKAKMTKSRMIQLSEALKNFVKAFDENLQMLDFDNLKLPDISSNKSNRNFQNEMSVIHEVAAEMNCNRNTLKESSNQISPSDIVSDLEAVEKDELSNGDPQSTSKPLQTESQLKVSGEIFNSDPQSKIESLPKILEDVAPMDVEMGPDCRAQYAQGKEGAKTEVTTFSGNECVQDSLQNNHPSTVKGSKIPKSLTGNRKRENSVKESKPQNEVHKRKSPEKICEESLCNAVRRKTYVVKSSNILAESESFKNMTNENRFQLDDNLNKPEDQLISKTDKRQTFVIKKNTILKETEPVVHLNNELATECIVSAKETIDKEDIHTKCNKRKTFVKRKGGISAFYHHVSENDPPSLSDKEYAVIPESSSTIIENKEQNLIPSSNVQFDCSKTVEIAVGKKSALVESSENREPSVEATLFDMNRKDSSSKEVEETNGPSTSDALNVSNRTREIIENIESKVDSGVPDQIATEAAIKNVDVMNNGRVFNDNSPMKTRRSLLELTESDNDVIMLDEFYFESPKPAFPTTPVRKKLLKNKQKKKYIFDANKNNSSKKKKLSCKYLNLERDGNSLQKNVATCQVGEGAAGYKSNIEKDDLISASDRPVIIQNSANIPSDASTVNKKTKKASTRKRKDNKSIPVKNNTEKNVNKTQKISTKKRDPSGIETDDLIPLPKKIKKKNKKKNEDIYFDDSTISKFTEAKNVNKVEEAKAIAKEPELDPPVKKTGKNTFLVKAEIHPPPPSSITEERNSEKEKLSPPHRQVAIVLNDILKSKDYEFLKATDGNETSAAKDFSSCSVRSFIIDPEESIERLRCEQPDNFELNTDAVLGTDTCEVKSDPVVEPESIRPRRRKEVNYKEPCVNRKMRRN